MTIDLTTPSAATDTFGTDRPAAALRGLATGGVHLPGDPGYDAARLPWNVAVDQRPAAVAYPRTAAEVGAVVRVAAEPGLRVAPQSTGHNAGPLAAQGLDDVVVVRTCAMNAVDRRPGLRHRPGRGRRALGAGRRRGRRPRPGRAARLLPRRRHRRLLARRRHRLVRPQAGPGHQQPHRGRARHRRRLAGPRRRRPRTRSSSGRSAEAAATSASSPRWSSGCTPSRRRTPGCCCGTSSTPRRCCAPGPRGRRTRRTRSPPSFRVMQTCRRCPSCRTFLRGRELVLIDGAVLGSDDAGRSCSATCGRCVPRWTPSAGCRRSRWSGCTWTRRARRPFVSDSRCSARSPTPAVDAFLEQVGPGAQTSLLMAELRQLGGALGRPHEGGGVLATSTRSSSPSPARSPPTPEMGAQGHADAVRLSAALAPWPTARQYLNFAENPSTPATAYADGVWTPAQGHPVARWTRTASSPPTTRSRAPSRTTPSPRES